MKKPLLILSLLGLLLLIGITACRDTSGTTPSVTSNSPLTYKNLTVSEVKDLITDDEEEIIILDVRTEGEYNSGHLIDAALIPVSELEGRLMEVSSDKNAKILVYDQSGLRSANASQLLCENGYTNVNNMLGGMTEWMATMGAYEVETCGG